MEPTNDTPFIKATATSIILGLIIAIGLALGGYFIGRGVINFKANQRTATVKGLADREVISDFVIWTLNLQRTGPDVSKVHADLKRDRDATIAFLAAHGIADAEIERPPTSTQDKFAASYVPVKDPNTRFVASSAIIVRSQKVDVVRATLSSMDELLQTGVLLAGGRNEGLPNVVYRYNKFNDLRPELIADATKNARASALKFAADSGKSVGSIRTAQQGLIQIFGEDGSDETAGYSGSSYRKKIRVVNTIEFDLE
jgi:uncharacterized protein